MDVPPSPKFQDQLVMVPGDEVEASKKPIDGQLPRVNWNPAWHTGCEMQLTTTVSQCVEVQLSLVEHAAGL